MATTTYKVKLGEVPRDVLIELVEEHPGALTPSQLVQRFDRAGRADEHGLTTEDLGTKVGSALGLLRIMGLASYTMDLAEHPTTIWTATDDGVAALHTTPTPPTNPAPGCPDPIASHATRPQTDPEPAPATRNEQGPHMADHQWGPGESLRTDSNRRPLHYE